MRNWPVPLAKSPRRSFQLAHLVPDASQGSCQNPFLTQRAAAQRQYQVQMVRRRAMMIQQGSPGKGMHRRSKVLSASHHSWFPCAGQQQLSSPVSPEC